MVDDSFALTDSTSDMPIKTEKRVSTCMGCGHEIYDQWILRVSPDLEWHAACLKCVDCHQFLDETCTCFVRDGKTYCKRDYVKLFGAKCSKCDGPFKKEDYVMRARDKIYHVTCFHCNACGRRLVPGEQFALRTEGLFCREDHEFVEKQSLNVSTDSGGSQDSFVFTTNLDASPDGSLPANGGHMPTVGAPAPISDPMKASPAASMDHSPRSNPTLSTGTKEKKKKEQKTTRVRTVLNEKQLHTLRTCYNANPRPDALMKEQLVEMTGLSPRVIRVWFQNKRCKDKKKQIMIKNIQQQQEKNQVLRMQGLGPLIAGSPSRHDVPMVPALDIHQFPQNPLIWGPPPQDFAPLKAPDNCIETETPPFQQLMHGFGDRGPESVESGVGGPMNFLTSAMSLEGPQVPARPGDMVSISPSVGAASDLSSPSCSD